MEGMILIMAKIIIIDDQTMLREMLSEILNKENDFNVIKTASNAKDSIELCESLKPDIVLMDVCTENESDGIYYAGIIKENFPNIKIIVMTGVLDITFINRAKKNNIDSFIYKNISKDSLINTIRNTLNGYSLYPNEKNIILQNNILKNLSDKELEVLTLYCKLLDREKVAEKLNISNSTLKTHIASIYKKTGYDNLAKLAIYCISNNFIVTNLNNI